MRSLAIEKTACVGGCVDFSCEPGYVPWFLIEFRVPAVSCACLCRGCVPSVCVPLSMPMCLPRSLHIIEKSAFDLATWYVVYMTAGDFSCVWSLVIEKTAYIGGCVYDRR